RAAGLLVPTDERAVSYVFNGLAGALDHAVVTPALAGTVEVHKWNLNSVEPEFLQYDVAGAATDTLSPFRSSDHDPVLIGLRFSGFPTGLAVTTAAPGFVAFPNPAVGGFRVQLNGIVAARVLTVDVLTATGQSVVSVSDVAARLPATLAHRTAHLPAGVYWLRVREPGFGPAVRVVKE
ncbi:MAG: T9SS type A sorting domain-containing protein, partial [Hymenobacteraceae bacterium]|nr:T9SS type A sorting domain-containing protein [Hymenobacteraceae bacterium]